MARMNDEEFEKAKTMVTDLHTFLNDHGDDNDEFFEIFPVLDTFLQKMKKQSGRK